VTVSKTSLKYKVRNAADFFCSITTFRDREDSVIQVNKPKFTIGNMLATPGALESLQAAGQTAQEFLSRHINGDWGCVCPEDAELNDLALQDGSRILSAYLLKTGVKIWVVTEAADENGHRSATTVLLPSEY
jgi:hypothetical protein